MCKKKEDEYALQTSLEYSLSLSYHCTGTGSIRFALGGFYSPSIV